MGRKSRSSSLTYQPQLPTTEDRDAANKLLQYFVHSRSANKDDLNFLAIGEKNAFFRAIQAASSTSVGEDSNGSSNISELSKKRLDGFFIMDTLATRMKEFDSLCSSANGGNSSSGGSHFHQLMTSQELESGYTPLHYSIVRRDLMSLLLLLKHASTESLSTVEQQRCNNNGGGLCYHPLQLLDGHLLTNNDYSITLTSNNNLSIPIDGKQNPRSTTINILSKLIDHEHLNPIQLLGKTSSTGLEYCRRSLSWRALRECWERDELRRLHLGQQHQQEKETMGISAAAPSSLPQRRYRRRIISFGNDSDYNDNLVNNAEEEYNDRTNGQGRMRSRGGSFIGNDGDYHSDEDSDEEGGGRGGSFDLRALHDNTDFHVLANEEEEDDDDNDNDEGGNEQERGRVMSQQLNQHRSHYQQQQQCNVKATYATNDYGCEVLTFGRESYKPKRVQVFSLGELRRSWTSSSSNTWSSSLDTSTSIGSNCSRRDGRDRIDSPAATVAASTHHTLVATRSGQLFAFGLGKGGRLGVGDESHRPLPTRILGPLSKRIVASIAAAENHSLCSTSDGAVFAWGSNGFGQLGVHSSKGAENWSNGGNGVGGSRLSPRRVEGELNHSFVVAVACGERHSVALTRLGEVYCWGDNKNGQLGVTMSNSESHTNGGPRRVEALWSAQPRRRAIAISAAAFSTLALTMAPTVSSGAERTSSLASLPVNYVYGWGHRNASPMRVVFPTGNSSTLQHSDSNAYTRTICINPIAIACAKYHNVAITSDGQVFTWGLHSDSLGVPSSQYASTTTPRQRTRINSQSSSPSSASSIISSPQLVVGMLPENGGGNAVAVSASESHTCIVTSDGHLFTWGESGKDNLGHKGVRWQPSPRKVKRVHRAVGVAAAKEHTVLLMGTTFPPLPNSSNTDGQQFYPLSLQASAAIGIARNVDLFNIIPIASVAYRFDCRPLINFCEGFIKENLDGVLAVGMKNDFDAFLSSRTVLDTTNYERDDFFHPFLYHLVNSRWVYEGRALLRQYESSVVSPSASKKVSKVARKEPMEWEKKAAPVEIKSIEGNAYDENLLEPTFTKVPKGKQYKADSTCASTKAGGKKHHCDLCGISCPDNDSFTLHVRGRKHRNRVMHTKAAEEKSVAERMMAMRRMQPVESISDRNAMTALRSDDAKPSINPWGGSQITTYPVGLAPVIPVKGKSFQDILKEEQQKKLAGNATRISSHLTGAKSPVFSPARPNKQSSNVISTAIAYNKKSPLNTCPFSSPTLGSFMARTEERKCDAVSSVGASWGATPATKSRTSSFKNWGLKQPPPSEASQHHFPPAKMKSFSEIQKEEEALRKKEDHMCRLHGNQWYVHQRERAASIGEIQQQEKEDKERLDLVEEQKQIEMEIMKQIQKEKVAKKKKQQQRSKRQGQRRNIKKKVEAKSPTKAMSPH